MPYGNSKHISNSKSLEKLKKLWNEFLLHDIYECNKSKCGLKA